MIEDVEMGVAGERAGVRGWPSVGKPSATSWESQGYLGALFPRPKTPISLCWCEGDSFHTSGYNRRFLMGTADTCEPNKSLRLSPDTLKEQAVTCANRF